MQHLLKYGYNYSILLMKYCCFRILLEFFYLWKTCNLYIVSFIIFFLEKLTYIFQKLNFFVRRFDNLEDFKMNRRLVEVSFEDHSQYDCFVCCILSHGVLQNIYGTNGRLVRIAELTGIFRSGKCPSLAGKPKLFFIQACQGREKQGGRLYQILEAVKGILK